MLLRAEPGKQRPRSCRTRELARSSGPRKGVAEKGWLTGLEHDRREGKTDNVRGERKTDLRVATSARWKNRIGASEARTQVVSPESTAFREGKGTPVSVETSSGASIRIQDAKRTVLWKAP